MLAVHKFIVWLFTAICGSKKKDLAEFSFLIIKRIQMTTAQRSKTDDGIMKRVTRLT